MRYQERDLPPWAPQLLISARLIQGGLMLSTIVYGVVVYTVASSFESAPSDPDGLRMLLSIAGLGACFIASIANRVLLKPERVVNRRHPDETRGRVLIGFLITWALAEVCAICGFILAFMLGDPSLYVNFGVIAFLTILAHPVTAGRLKTFS